MHGAITRDTILGFQEPPLVCSWGRRDLNPELDADVSAAIVVQTVWPVSIKEFCGYMYAKHGRGFCLLVYQEIFTLGFVIIQGT